MAVVAEFRHHGRAMIWRARQLRFEFPRPALVMGILNVTPDSFFDGGRYAGEEAALARARVMVEQGVDIIDVGGESTRPRSVPVRAQEEMRRVLPVIGRLARAFQVPISIDTFKVEVAEAALDAGASIINDVGAARDTGAMARLVARSGAGYVAMHAQGTPQTMQENPLYTDVVGEVDDFFGQHLGFLEAAGVLPEQVVLDVGIGFGKRLEHNLLLLGALERFTKWKRPMLLGVSRKSFIDLLLGATVQERLPAALACAGWALGAGVQIIRTHDVQETRLAMRMTEAILAHKMT